MVARKTRLPRRVLPLRVRERHRGQSPAPHSTEFHLVGAEQIRAQETRQAHRLFPVVYPLTALETKTETVGDFEGARLWLRFRRAFAKFWTRHSVGAQVLC